MKIGFCILMGVLVLAAAALVNPPQALADDDDGPGSPQMERMKCSMGGMGSAEADDDDDDNGTERRKGWKRGGWGGRCDWKDRDCGYGQHRRCPVPFLCILFTVLAIIHVLLAIEVFKDVRASEPKMSGLWVAVVLLGGLPATVAYALFRLVQIKSAGK
ncbi:MAG: hypothetical protein A3G34_11930 [Candidatus Lindowbacteria bacterium RIFCSPLOWO2_12_FULL_62_27]|nr:MAG: hypothetical protein A3I06_01505 [Candidatus Lindowbacteria bacterium RIFCSPLOWO2_02_FULL_62_12]OGH61085.1 MAG: hypothetical protein A3G34_11930 [Candidatus Lindowbacteria bacterium RIFCSPLOWO2_12_FULL_62_27]